MMSFKIKFPMYKSFHDLKSFHNLRSGSSSAQEWLCTIGRRGPRFFLLLACLLLKQHKTIFLHFILASLDLRLKT